jgi:hypothetical protein
MIIRQLVPHSAKFLATLVLCLTSSAYAENIPTTYGELVGIWKSAEIDSADGKISPGALFEKSGSCTFTSLTLGDHVAGTCTLEKSIIRASDVVIDNGPPDPKRPSGKTLDFHIISYDGTKLKLSEGKSTYEVTRLTPRF